MPEYVGLLTHNQDLDEIVRRLLAPWNICWVDDVNWFPALAQGPLPGRAVVDWFECSRRERQFLMAWERQGRIGLIDISGAMAPGPCRTVFVPPFSWKKFAAAVSAADRGSAVSRRTRGR